MMEIIQITFSLQLQQYAMYTYQQLGRILKILSFKLVQPREAN